MQAVNLLPAYARPGHRWATLGSDVAPRRALAIGGIVAGVVAIAMGAAYIFERSVVNDKRSELATATARLTAVQAEAAPLRATQAAAASQLAAATTISQSRVPWESVLGGLARVLPDQVYLTSLQATTPTPVAGLATAPVTMSAPAAAAPATPPAGFSISGIASSHVRVALVLDRLALMPWLSNVTLGSSVRTGSGPGASNSGGDQFAISAAFSNAGGAK
jgi:Tfp pilus assembly protein PilN